MASVPHHIVLFFCILGGTALVHGGCNADNKKWIFLDAVLVQHCGSGASCDHVRDLLVMGDDMAMARGDMIDLWEWMYPAEAGASGVDANQTRVPCSTDPFAFCWVAGAGEQVRAYLAHVDRSVRVVRWNDKALTDKSKFGRLETIVNDYCARTASAGCDAWTTLNENWDHCPVKHDFLTQWVDIAARNHWRTDPWSLLAPAVVRDAHVAAFLPAAIARRQAVHVPWW